MSGSLGHVRALGRTGRDRCQIAEDDGVEVLSVERLSIDVSRLESALYSGHRTPVDGFVLVGRARRGAAQAVDGVRAGTLGQITRDQTVGDERRLRVEFPVRTSAGPTLL